MDTQQGCATPYVSEYKIELNSKGTELQKYTSIKKRKESVAR